jgi:hypothetical protein
MQHHRVHQAPHRAEYRSPGATGHGPLPEDPRPGASLASYSSQSNVRETAFFQYL